MLHALIVFGKLRPRVFAFDATLGCVLNLLALGVSIHGLILFTLVTFPSRHGTDKNNFVPGYQESATKVLLALRSMLAYFGIIPVPVEL